MITPEDVKQVAINAGFSEAGEIQLSNLKFHRSIRKMCEDNVCRNYSTTWACPPAVGTLEECMQRCSQYAHMVIFNQVFSLKNSYDFEGMKQALLNFKATVDIFYDSIHGKTEDLLILSNESCVRCRRCTYPDEPCRFQDRLFHSIEGYGFIVSDLAKEAGIKYTNGPNTVTYFGAILW